MTPAATAGGRSAYAGWNSDVQRPFVFRPRPCHRVEMIDLPRAPGTSCRPRWASGCWPISRSLIRINGSSIEPPQEFRRLIIQKLQRTYVFQEVAALADSGTIRDREKAVNLEASINGALETRELGKSVLLFLLFLTAQ